MRQVSTTHTAVKQHADKRTLIPEHCSYIAFHFTMFTTALLAIREATTLNHNYKGSDTSESSQVKYQLAVCASFNRAPTITIFM